MIESVLTFIMGILGRVISGLSTTYLVRLFDKFKHEKNRPELK